MSFINELTLLLKARLPFTYVLTTEEVRLEYTLRKEFAATPMVAIYSWNFIDGFKGNPTIQTLGQRNPIQTLETIEQISTKNQTIFILKDFNKFLGDITINRKIKNLLQTLKNQKKTILISSSELTIPSDLITLFTILEFQLPNKYEIENEIQHLLTFIKSQPSKEIINSLILACQGLTIEKIRRSFSKVLINYKTINQDSIQFILTEKNQILKQTQLLDLVSTNTSILDIGGLENLKYWLRIRKKAFNKNAEIYGLEIPRGLLIVGIQGTGKSLTAKAIASDWQFPLLKLDMGKVFKGIIGESEKNLRQIIEISEAMSPCVLWIDEIEKAFFNNRTINDSGTTSRILGTMLTWLAEKKTAVFVVATANKLSELPNELIRKGRFDEIFFINLPNYQERILIWKVCLKKLRPIVWQRFNLGVLSTLTKGFSGAEIKQSIQEALYNSYNKQTELNQAELEKSIKSITPLAQIKPEELKKMENWAIQGQIRIA